MAVPPRRVKEAGTYFITSRTWESRNLFAKPAVCEILIETLLHYREEHNYLLHSFVLMPDHIHVMLTPNQEITLERAVQFIKGGSARRISKDLNFRFPVWQRGYTDHRVRDPQDYQTHCALYRAESCKGRLGGICKGLPVVFRLRTLFHGRTSGVKTPEESGAYRHG